MPINFVVVIWCVFSLLFIFIYYYYIIIVDTIICLFICLFWFIACSDGIFFAVKEVSLLDEGSQGKQSVYQLEQVRCLKWSCCNFLIMPIYPFVYCMLYGIRSVLLIIISCWNSLLRPPFFYFYVQEIDLLSKFEHENIVQYLGTAKVLFSFCVVTVFSYI